MEWAMSSLQQRLLKDSSGERKTSNTVEITILYRFLLITIALVCAGYLTMGVYKQWQERPLVTGLKANLSKQYFSQNLNSGHEQASEGHALPQCHHLHRRNQHGRYHRGDGVINTDTPPYYYYYRL